MVERGENLFATFDFIFITLQLRKIPWKSLFDCPRRYRIYSNTCTRAETYCYLDCTYELIKFTFLPASCQGLIALVADVICLKQKPHDEKIMRQWRHSRDWNYICNMELYATKSGLYLHKLLLITRKILTHLSVQNVVLFCL